MKRTLIVVDMQNDFIDMALGTKEAVAIVPKVKEKIEEYEKTAMRLFSQEIHTVKIIFKQQREKIFLSRTVLKAPKVGKLQTVFMLKAQKS